MIAEKIHLITGKPAAFYNLLRVSAVLFCFILCSISSKPHFALEKKKNAFIAG